jgi:serine/threonine protein kinase
VTMPSPRLMETIAKVKTESGTTKIAEGFDDVLPWFEPNDEGLGKLGHYTILECIGRGGMGVVFRARDNSLHRDVAVKVLAPSYAMNDSAQKRFIREAHAVARVQHANVVAIHAVEEGGKIPFFVMELVNGPSLQDLLEERGNLSVDETIKLGIQIADGLEAAHQKNVVHRDVKPANVLLTPDTKTAKVSDFGLAYIADQTALTRSGIIVGTPAFVAPENIDESTVPDHRSDLFSLGSVLYRMVSGEVPFRGGSTLATLHKISTATPPPLREHNADTPQWLVEVIEKLHEKSPADRFASAADVARCLRAGVAGQTVEIPRSKTAASRAATSSKTNSSATNTDKPTSLLNIILTVALAGIVFYAAWLVADNYISGGSPIPAVNGHDEEEDDHDRDEDDRDKDDRDKHERDEEEHDEDDHDEDD